MDEIVYGVVRVGFVDTPFVRAGTGAPVLLATSWQEGRIAQSRIFRRLCREFRVVAPVLDKGSGRGGMVRLASLVEALGMQMPILVVAGELRDAWGLGANEGQPEVAGVLPVPDGPGGDGLDELLAAVRRMVVEKGVERARGGPQEETPSRI